MIDSAGSEPTLSVSVGEAAATGTETKQAINTPATQASLKARLSTADKPPSPCITRRRPYGRGDPRGSLTRSGSRRTCFEMSCAKLHSSQSEQDRARQDRRDANGATYAAPAWRLASHTAVVALDKCWLPCVSRAGPVCSREDDPRKYAGSSRPGTIGRLLPGAMSPAILTALVSLALVPSALGAGRRCGSLTVARQSPLGPYAEGSSANHIIAVGVPCRAARSAIRQCVFHTHVTGWVALAGPFSTNHPSRSEITRAAGRFPNLAPLVHGRPAKNRLVSFQLAGGTPRCLTTAQVVVGD